jgi:hypothetical protein
MPWDYRCVCHHAQLNSTFLTSPRKEIPIVFLSWYVSPNLRKAEILQVDFFCTGRTHWAQSSHIWHKSLDIEIKCEAELETYQKLHLELL